MQSLRERGAGCDLRNVCHSFSDNENGSLRFGRLPSTTVWPDGLLPAYGEDGLHILRTLIDRLIPREASLCREPGHRLDQLIDLRAE